MSNDTDGEQSTGLSAQLVTQPGNGTLIFRLDGSFDYTPRSGFSGLDRFTYRAIDDGGLQSAPATVNITVASGAEFQNPTSPRDVNADGFVSPIDALLLINHLNAVGSHLLTSPLPGIPFPDTNGDGFISPADVLGVVNQLNSASNPEGEGLVQVTSAEPADEPLVPGFAIQLTTGGTVQLTLEPAVDERLATESDDPSAESFFSELGYNDFARQQRAMGSAARASLAAKAQDLESALDSLFGVNDLEDELVN